AVIAQLIGESGVVARLTDIAYTVLVMDAAKLGQVADHLVKVIAEHAIKVDGELSQVTVSIGSAMLSVLPNEADAALDGVEQACADARAGGGNAHRAFRIARERFADSDSDDKNLAKCVRDAITSRRLKLLFQPIASLRGEPGERYEAQLRMLNEKRDEIHPRQFMAAAIRYQLAPSLDRWVLLTVMARCVQRRKEGKGTAFFVKIAPTTVLDAKFLPWFKDQLAKARINGQDLVFEITETTILEHLAETKAFHATLKKLGCRFAIDNFGLSSGALKLLKHIHPDYVRVHGDLIEVIHEDDAALNKVREIAKAVAAMGATTIATHVNDAVLLPVLWQAGADLMQGGFLQEPGEGLTFDFVDEMF
ncbi:MAG: GGDEF domain-containing protein, partial [Gammaproteobacteria bacterium]|nr:GGDEF domain-containing protein [Gammaproteobacteria bacterium]